MIRAVHAKKCRANFKPYISFNARHIHRPTEQGTKSKQLMSWVIERKLIHVTTRTLHNEPSTGKLVKRILELCKSRFMSEKQYKTKNTNQNHSKTESHNKQGNA